MCETKSESERERERQTETEGERERQRERERDRDRGRGRERESKRWRGSEMSRYCRIWKSNNRTNQHTDEISEQLHTNTYTQSEIERHTHRVRETEGTREHD